MSTLEIPEHEAIVRALRTEHQELSHDIESLSSVLVGLLGLKKQYQVGSHGNQWSE